MKLRDAIEKAGEGGSVVLDGPTTAVVGTVTKLTNTSGEWDVRWLHGMNATVAELTSENWIVLEEAPGI